MKIPMRWLREFVDITLSADEIGRLLTVSGIEVAGVTHVGGDWENIVIGRVDTVERHPNADHLFVAQINGGSETWTLVTAADNLKVGDVVPVIRPGGQLAPGVVLSARNFRGIRSEGMMAS